MPSEGQFFGKVRAWRLSLVVLPVMLILVLGASPGPQPFAPEQVLPNGTLAVLFADLQEVRDTILPLTSYGRLQKDPQLDQFQKDALVTINNKIVEPLQREFGIDVKEFKSLLKGPVVVAIVSTNESSWVVLVESTNRDALRAKLQQLRSDWRRDGKALAIESVLNENFAVLSPGPDSVLMQLRQFFPHLLDYQELGRNERPARASTPKLFVGQVGSALTISGSLSALEPLVARCAGSAAPALAGEAGFESCKSKLFANSPLWIWINTKALADVYKPPEAELKPPPSPFDVVDNLKIMDAGGIRAVTAAGWAIHAERDGVKARAWVQVSHEERKGLLELLTGEPREVGIPPFVSVDCAEFSRWRFAGRKTWESLDQMMRVISPEWSVTVQHILQAATEHGRVSDPELNVKQTIVQNLGDDLILLRRKISPSGEDIVKASPVLYLVGSPRPELLMKGLQHALLFMAAETDPPQSREFLGRKIYSIPLPSIPLPFGEVAAAPIGSRLHYAATSSYVALCTDPSFLEEFLRSPESRVKSLRELEGMKETLARAVTPFSSSLAYESELPWASAAWEKARLRPRPEAGQANNSTRLDPLSIAGFTDAPKEWNAWIDTTSLPPFNRVAKHFNLRIRSVSANAEGITIQWHWPVPRQE